MSEVAGGAPAIPGLVDLVPVGRGGFGVVYRAHQPDLGRNVAVKVIASPGTPEEAVERWRREVTAMGRLSNHPNILPVFAGGVTPDGSPYLVMPFVPDGSLGDRLRRHGPLPPEEVADLGAKLAGALATAHGNGVLHRDLKPDNVLLSPYGEPQLSDFGIARLVDATATLTGTIQASLPYAAPEVLAGHPATAAADVYGLGATLFACLTGGPPFPVRADEPLVAFVGRLATEPAPDLERCGVPAPLAGVVGRALAKDPAARTASAAALKRELEAAGARLVPPSGSGPTAGTSATTRVVAPRREGWTEVVPAAQGTAPTATVPSGAQRRPVVPRAGLARREPGRAGIIAGLVVVALLVAAIAAVLLDERDGERAAAPAGGEATTTPERPTAPSTAPADPTTTSPTPTTAATTTVAPAGDLATAAGRYLSALAAGDLDGAYGMLSPAFRAAQSQASFEAFWGAADEVAVVGPPTVDEASGTATVPITIDGRREDFRLELVEGDDGWLVDGPRPR